MTQTNTYAPIVKMDDNGDGTLTVYGKATDDSLDIDQQICDPVWLDRAMPEWFMTGGNIREQHSNIAAGVAEEYERKADGHYISALVVDPVSVKKVRARVLKGFSIGIKSPRVVRDQKAANGRIVDGQIVEVSLVDRPANPNAKLILAKSVEGQKTLTKTEELVEKHGDHDQSDHDPRGGGGGAANSEGGRDNAEVESISDSGVDVSDEFDDYLDDLEEGRVKDDEEAEKEGRIVERAQNSFNEARELLDDATRPSSIVEHHDTLESAAIKLEEAIDTLSEGNLETRGLQSGLRDMLQSVNLYLSGIDSDKSATGKEPSMKERKTRARKSALEKEADGMPMNGEAKAVPSREEMMERYAGARKALDEITRMCKEYGYGDIEKQYGETAEQETEEGSYPGAAEEEVGEARGEKPLDKEVLIAPNEMADKSTNKCLECGCHQPSNNHGGGSVTLPDGTTANMTSADMVTEKSTITPLPTVETIGSTTADEDSDDENSADKSLLADVKLNDIIEKAVKSAMASVEAEIATLKSAKEAVESKAVSLETELAAAKSLAIGGGPKRTTIATGAKTNNELLAKANMYRAKAEATTDQILAKGYRDLAKDFLAKANAPEAESK